MTPALQLRGTDTLLAVKVQARAARTELCGLLGNELKVRLAAPPVEGAANEALVRFLAAGLKLPRAAVSLERGQASQHKIIRIKGLAPAEVAARLGLAP